MGLGLQIFTTNFELYYKKKNHIFSECIFLGIHKGILKNTSEDVSAGNARIVALICESLRGLGWMPRPAALTFGLQPGATLAT